MPNVAGLFKVRCLNRHSAALFDAKIRIGRKSHSSRVSNRRALLRQNRAEMPQDVGTSSTLCNWCREAQGCQSPVICQVRHPPVIHRPSPSVSCDSLGEFRGRNNFTSHASTSYSRHIISLIYFFISFLCLFQFSLLFILFSFLFSFFVRFFSSAHFLCIRIASFTFALFSKLCYLTAPSVSLSSPPPLSLSLSLSLPLSSRTSVLPSLSPPSLDLLSVSSRRHPLASNPGHWPSSAVCDLRRVRP